MWCCLGQFPRCPWLATQSHVLPEQARSVRYMAESRRKPFRQAAIGNAFAAFMLRTGEVSEARRLSYRALNSTDA
jgi:hypothetical protein